MAHENAEMRRWDKLCKNVLVIETLNHLYLTVFYLHFVILYNTKRMSHLKAIKNILTPKNANLQRP
jgi:hypothetical protein